MAALLLGGTDAAAAKVTPLVLAKLIVLGLVLLSLLLVLEVEVELVFFFLDPPGIMLSCDPSPTPTEDRISEPDSRCPSNKTLPCWEGSMPDACATRSCNSATVVTSLISYFLPRSVTCRLEMGAVGGALAWQSRVVVPGAPNSANTCIHKFDSRNQKIRRLINGTTDSSLLHTHQYQASSYFHLQFDIFLSAFLAVDNFER
jgi:hypothetical protein